MDPNKMMEIQTQMKHNQADIQNFMKDLDGWENEIKAKDEQLKTGENESVKLPPVRNSLLKKKTKKKKKSTTKEASAEKVIKSKSGYEYYQKWDKFDVDQACEDVDEDSNTSSEEEETDEEWETERKKEQANLLKDQGNQYFKEGKLTESIECYTQAMSYDSMNVVLPANRAMALLKQKKFAAAEADCTLALSIDPTYSKSYYRRGMARKELKKFSEARKDFERLLVLEPTSKVAQTEINRVDMMLHPESSATEDCGIVKAVYKPASQRSKKPLRRIHIEEIGIEDESLKLSEKNRERVNATVEKQFQRIIDGKSLPDGEHDGTRSKVDAHPGVETVAAPKNMESEKPSTMASTSTMDNTSTMDDTKLVTESSTDSSSPRIPDVPQNSFQFQSDWKSLCTNKDKLYQYLKKIDCRQFKKLFGEALESNMLMDLITTLKEHYTSDSDIYDVMRNLCDVKRFSMTVMFLSSNEKQVIKDVLDRLVTNGSLSKDDVKTIAKKYDVKL